MSGSLGHLSEWRRLPFRVSEAILKPYSLERGIPILTYESDGFSAHPAFLRQVDVHIQQVLAGRHGCDAPCCTR